MTRAEPIAVQVINDGVDAAGEAGTEYGPTLRAATGIYVPQHGIARSCKALSRREKEVLYWLALGRSGKDIARTLDIGVCTVRAHIRNIIRKLDAVNIPHAVARAFMDGTLHMANQPFAATK